jgi:hypothetical protein
MEQIVLANELYWENKTVACEEYLKVNVFFVPFIVIIKPDDVIVVLCVEEFISKVSKIPGWEIVLHKQLAGFERLVVNERKHVILF